MVNVLIGRNYYLLSIGRNRPWASEFFVFLLSIWANIHRLLDEVTDILYNDQRFGIHSPKHQVREERTDQFSRQVQSGTFFGLEKCLDDFVLTWWTCFENSILVQFGTKMDQNRIWTRDHKFRREWPNRIFEASSSRENEVVQTLFWTKKGPSRTLRIDPRGWSLVRI